MPFLHYHSTTDNGSQNHFDAFGYEEIFFAFGKEGNCAVAVLNYAVGKENA